MGGEEGRGGEIRGDEVKKGGDEEMFFKSYWAHVYLRQTFIQGNISNALFTTCGTSRDCNAS